MRELTIISEICIYNAQQVFSGNKIAIPTPIYLGVILSLAQDLKDGKCKMDEGINLESNVSETCICYAQQEFSGDKIAFPPIYPGVILSLAQDLKRWKM